MKAHLTRRYWFSASHRLHSDEMSAEENRATYGKCNNPYGHGHNYALEVTVSGAVDASTGMVCNLADLDGFMAKEILARYEHVNLNTLPEFVRLGAERRIGDALEVGAERVDGLDRGAHALRVALVLGAEDRADEDVQHTLYLTLLARARGLEELARVTV